MPRPILIARLQPIMPGVSAFLCLLFILHHVHFQGAFADPDCFMRLVKVHQLLKTGDWQNSTIHNSNYPYGESTHWTLPLDILLLAGAAPLATFMGWHAALETWAICLSPALFLLCAPAFWWAIRPIVHQKAKPFCFLLFLAMPFTAYTFMAGRPDHHSLLALCSTLLLGLTIRTLLFRTTTAFLIATGATIALGIWISVEFTVQAVLSLAAILASICHRPSSHDLRLFLPLLTTAILLTVAIAIEQSFYEMLQLRLDQINLLLLAGIWSLALLLPAAIYLAGPNPQRRYLFALGTVLFAVLPILWLAPLSPPVFPEQIKTIWLDTVLEIQPFLSDSREQIPRTLLLLFLLLPSVAIFIRNINKPAWLYLAVSTCVFATLTILQQRWAFQIGLLLAIPLATAFQPLLRTIPAKLHPTARLSLASFPWLMLAWAGLASGTIEPKNENQFYPRTQLRQLATEWSSETLEPKAHLLAHFDFGAELLYRTPYKITATGYHRNASGILDYATIMASAPPDTIAISLLKQRQITHILVTDYPVEASLFQHLPECLHTRLLQNRPPPWLIPLPTSTPHAKRYRIQWSSDLLFEPQ